MTNPIEDYINKTISLTGCQDIRQKTNDLMAERNGLIQNIEDRKKITELEAELKEKEAQYEQEVIKFETLYEAFSNKTDSIHNHETQKLMKPVDAVNENVEAMDKLVDKLDIAEGLKENFRKRKEELDEGYLFMRQISDITVNLLMKEIKTAGRKFVNSYKVYKWRKVWFSSTPKILHLFWSLIVFTLGLDYALDPIKDRLIKVVALVILWMLLEFYLVPKLNKYLENKKYESLKRITDQLYLNKVMLICNIELYEYYQKR